MKLRQKMFRLCRRFSRLARTLSSNKNKKGVYLKEREGHKIMQSQKTLVCII